MWQMSSLEAICTTVSEGAVLWLVTRPRTKHNTFLVVSSGHNHYIPSGQVSGSHLASPFPQVQGSGL